MKFTKKVLENGLTLIVVPMPGNPTVTVFTGSCTGSEYEDKRTNGLSHFLEHMCFKATEKRPNAKIIAQELDEIGANNNAYTGQEHTIYYAKSDKTHFDTILDVVSDIYLHPTFPKTELEKERGVILQEYKMYLDDLKWHAGDLWQELLYGDTPSGRRIVGTPETIGKLQRKDFVAYHKKQYVAENTVVVIAGDVDESTVEKKVKEKFADINTGKFKKKAVLKEKQNAPMVKVFHKDSDQTHIVLGVRSFGSNDKRVKIMRVMRAVLSGGMSSRLFQKMREELGICYYVYASQDSFTDHGNFSVSAGVDQKRLDVAINAILAELRKLVLEKITDEELKKTKEGMLGRLKLGLESSDDVGSFFLDRAISRQPLVTPKELEKEVMDVSAEDIQNLAKELFVDKKLNLVVVGKHKNEKELKGLLTFSL